MEKTLRKIQGNNPAKKIRMGESPKGNPRRKPAEKKQGWEITLRQI
jgi:hypothetical protein